MRYLFTVIGLFLGLLASTQNELDTVLVTASRLKNTLQGANRTVQIIEKEQIEKAPVNSVAELLYFAAGIDARQRGMWGTQTDLSIRGGTFEQVLILVNGARINDPQTGHHSMNLPVQKDDIERIEVLLGGGSYIFGGSAFSGVINIITKSSANNSTSLKVEAGSFNSLKAGISENLSGKNHQSRISLNHTRSAGFKRNTDFNNTNLFAQSNIKLPRHELKLMGGYTWQNFGAQNFYTTNFPQQYEKTRTLFLNAGLRSGNKVQINREVYWRRNWDEFQLFRESDDFYQYENGLFIQGTDTAPAWYSRHNYHRSDVLGGNVDIQFKSPFGKSSIGAEYRYEKVLSNNLGEPLEAPVNIEGSRGAYTLGAQRHNISLAAEQLKKFGRLSISAAVQANYNSSFDFQLYPAATVGYKLNRKNKFYSSFNRSFRLPSYTDLYYRLGGAIGSSSLQPENSLNYEAGYKFMAEKIFVNLSVFRREGRNIIDWVKDCDTCVVQATNTSAVNFNGLEMSLKLKGQAFLQSLKVNSVELGYSYLFTDESDFNYQSVYVYDYLQHKAILRILQNFSSRFTLSYMLSYQQRRGSFLDAQSGREQEYPSVFLINARASYRFNWAELFISAQNLTNQTYFDRANAELPGLWLWGGLKFQF